MRSLPAPSVMRVLRDLVQSICRGLRLLEGQVAQRNDADQPLVAIQHGKPADLQLAHVARHVGHRFILVDVLHVLGHHIADLAFIRGEAPGDGAYRNVAIAQHTYQAVILANGHHAEILFLHQLRRRSQVIAGRHDCYFAGHYFADLHSTPPSLYRLRHEAKEHDGPAARRLLSANFAVWVGQRLILPMRNFGGGLRAQTRARASAAYTCGPINVHQENNIWRIPLYTSSSAPTTFRRQELSTANSSTGRSRTCRWTTARTH